MNYLVATSLLLSIPGYIASKDPRVYDVAILSFVCTLTSILNHGWRHIAAFTTLDKLVVRTIGFYYCALSLYKRKNIYHALTIWFGLLAIYLYTTRPSYEMQWLVHIVAMMGMLCYIKAETINEPTSSQMRV